MKPPFPKCWDPQTKPHRFCPGCGHGISLKTLGWVIDDLNLKFQTILGIDIGCSLLAWDLFDVDTIQTHHGRTTSLMVGLKIANPDSVALAYMGDGGGYAIGLQYLIHAAHRNDPLTVIIINNSLYAMTGGQMAPTTTCDQITVTSPKGRDCNFGLPFAGPEAISLLATPKAYFARGIVNNFYQLKNFMTKAINNQIKNNSFSLLEILSTCPVNWHLPVPASFKFLDDLAKVFPVGEIKNGKVNNE
jgi:2-oxoglutarate ferredoxin oxidoreductase subunit beta